MPSNSAHVSHEVVEYFDPTLRSNDPLQFPNYGEQLERLGGEESVQTGRTPSYVFIRGNFSVMGGSMGVVHGERVVRAFDRATALRLPIVITTVSGGARMQEGMVSLIQMARTAAASERHRAAGLLQIAWMGNPTTGGVFASYGMLATVRAAPPSAYLGFGGPRVLAAFGEAVKDSHSAETALAHGLIHALVPEEDRDQWVTEVLTRDHPTSEGSPSIGSAFDETLGPFPEAPLTGDSDHKSRGFRQANSEQRNAWDVVCAARDTSHPSALEIAQRVITAWSPIGSQDPVVQCASGNLEGSSIVVIATDRFAGSGRPTPEGYRAAIAALHYAIAHGLPVISFVDLPGADPSARSENAGVAGAIAATFALMMTAPIPIVSVTTGEGGSGGALALACADQFGVCEDAFFSVIAPEGAAAILDREANTAPQRAKDLRVLPEDLVALGVADEVVPASEVLSAGDIAALLNKARPGQRRERWDQAAMQALTIQN